VNQKLMECETTMVKEVHGW